MLHKSNSTNTLILKHGYICEPNLKSISRSIAKFIIEISKLQEKNFIVKDDFFLSNEKKIYSFNFYDIQKFIVLLNKHGKLPIDVNIHAFVYILRFINESSSYKITKNNWILIVFISYILASKWCDDISINNESFAYLYNNIVSLKKINALEIKFLKTINFKLLVSMKDYTEIYFELINNYL